MTISSGKEPCPWLPYVAERLGPETTRRHPEKGAAFYLATLRYAQSQWLDGKPAQAILQINKSFMADLNGDEAILEQFPPAYRALDWIIGKSWGGTEGFVGNPVRHFQHLASRMSGPRGEIRTWRAWACFHLACHRLEGKGFPKDGVQLAREGLWIPGKERVHHEIRRKGWPREMDQLL